MVVMNTSIGSVFMIIGSVYILLKRDFLISQFVPILNYLEGGLTLPLILAAALMFLATTNSLSSSLISLEGKYFWLAKSIPIPIRQILQAKILTHLLTAAIPSFVASLLLSFIATNLLEWVLIFILPLSFTFFAATAGLAINLIYPKLEWLNEVIVVKQGMSAMIAIFGGMGVAAGCAVLYIYCTSIPLSTYLYILTAIFAISALLFYNWLINQGTHKFESL
jgi:ABC-2 type transport system permease protein